MDPNLNPNIPPVSPPVNAAAQVNLVNTSFENPKKGLKIVIIAVILTIFVLASLVGVSVAIAYDKLKINYPLIEKPITQFVMNLPFTPKTPKFLLESSAIAHAKVSKQSFNISLAAKSDSFVSVLGLSQLDVEVKGNIDYSDPTNLKTTINGSITKDFNFDVRKKDNILYFKINKFPSLISTFLNLDQNKLTEILKDWVGFDTKPLDTEARRNLDQNSPQKSLTKEYAESMVDYLLDDKLLPSLSVEKGETSNYPSYKIHLKADQKTIDNLIYKVQSKAQGKETRDLSIGTTKPSNYIKNLDLDMWIDQKDYFVRKIVTSFTFNPNYKPDNLPGQTLGVSTKNPNILGAESSLYSLGTSESFITTVVSLDDFGKDFAVDIPDKHLTPEEFFEKVFQASKEYQGEASSSAGFSTTELTKRARDAARLSDLANMQMAINVAVQESKEPTQKVLCSSGGSSFCSGSSFSGTRQPDGTGWLKVNLSDKKVVAIPILPIDPVNNSILHYSYCSNGAAWEINTILESDQQKNKMATDGGDEPNIYEVGSDLGLIGKFSSCRY